MRGNALIVTYKLLPFMKHLSFLLIFGICVLPLFGQQKDDLGKTIYLELNQRANFYEVNARYEVNPDTVFFTNPGFLVYPDYDTATFDNTPYIVLRYPAFRNGEQQILDTSSTTGAQLAPGNNTNPFHIPLLDKNDKFLLITKEAFDQIDKLELRSRKQISVSSGLLTVPFKLRPKIDTTEFTMSTDVSLGPYIGITKRLSRRKDYFITIPLNLGLSYININENTTSNLPSESKVGVVPGVSWSTGIVFELNKVNFGIIAGKDYASGVGKDWIYQDKLWFSFAIGYNFLNRSK